MVDANRCLYVFAVVCSGDRFTFWKQNRIIVLRMMRVHCPLQEQGQLIFNFDAIVIVRMETNIFMEKKSFHWIWKTLFWNINVFYVYDLFIVFQNVCLAFPSIQIFREEQLKSELIIKIKFQMCLLRMNIWTHYSVLVIIIIWIVEQSERI